MRKIQKRSLIALSTILALQLAASNCGVTILRSDIVLFILGAGLPTFWPIATNLKYAKL